MAYTDVGQACVGWIGLLAGTLLTTYYAILPMDRAARRHCFLLTMALLTMVLLSRDRAARRHLLTMFILTMAVLNMDRAARRLLTYLLLACYLVITSYSFLILPTLLYLQAPSGS